MERRFQSRLVARSLDEKNRMIEKFFSNLITLGFGALTSLSTILRIFLVGSITFSLAAFYLPFFKSKWKRLKDVDNLPGPKCTSVIMGNIPYNMLWNSILNAKDYKSIIISELLCHLNMKILNTEY